MSRLNGSIPTPFPHPETATRITTHVLKNKVKCISNLCYLAMIVICLKGDLYPGDITRYAHVSVCHNITLLVLVYCASDTEQLIGLGQTTLRRGDGIDSFALLIFPC